MSSGIDIYIDGACSGNPGQASIGILIKSGKKKIKEISKPIGEATNNIAEYSALVYALQEAMTLGAKDIHVYTDSELVYKQLTGQYKIKKLGLKFLFDQVQILKKFFREVKIQHIPREQNQEADKLAECALRQEQATMVASLFKNSEEESPSSEG